MSHIRPCLPSRAATLALVLACLAPWTWAQESTLRKSHLMDLASTLKVPTLLLLMDAGKAQPLPDFAALGLESAVSLGLTSNLDVQAAQHRAESFNEARHAARGALLTKLDLKLGYGRGRLDSVDPHVTLPRKEATLTLRQPLFDAAAYSEWQRQGVLADSAHVQQSGAASSAAMEIAQAYLQAMQLRLTIEINKDYETLLNELLRYITERAAGGAASMADRDRVRSRVASARTAMSDARANFKLAQRNLERLLGEPVASLSVQGLDNLDVPDELDEAKEKARTQNHDLLAAQADVAAAQIERTGQIARFLPRVDLEITRMHNVNAGGTENRFIDNKAMLMVTVPLLNGGTDMAQVRGAEARREEQRAKALNVERKVMQDLDAAYANINSATERYRSVTEELQANQSVVDAFKAQLTAANRSLLDVLDAYQRLYQTKLDITQVVVTETQNHIKVAHLTGTLLALLPTGTH
jgi:TolC family type I secretion outer membrane protein